MMFVGGRHTIFKKQHQDFVGFQTLLMRGTGLIFFLSTFSFSHNIFREVMHFLKPSEKEEVR